MISRPCEAPEPRFRCAVRFVRMVATLIALPLLFVVGLAACQEPTVNHNSPANAGRAASPAGKPTKTRKPKPRIVLRERGTGIKTTRRFKVRVTGTSGTSTPVTHLAWGCSPSPRRMGCRS